MYIQVTHPMVRVREEALKLGREDERLRKEDQKQQKNSTH